MCAITHLPGLEPNLTSWIVDDYLVSSAPGDGMSAQEYGSTYMGYWSMRNDTLHLSSEINYAPPVVQTINATVWSWVINPNLSVFLPCAMLVHS